MDHRAVPLEVLREFVRSATELSSIRAVAEDAGVGRSTVHKLITAGTIPHPRVRRLLALWYLRRIEGVNEVELVRPYVAALDVLVQNLPEPWRTRAAAGALDRIEQTHTDAGEEPPRWLVTLRERVTRNQLL
jgi:hypothetical protein